MDKALRPLHFDFMTYLLSIDSGVSSACWLSVAGCKLGVPSNCLTEFACKLGPTPLAATKRQGTGMLSLVTQPL